MTIADTTSSINVYTELTRTDKAVRFTRRHLGNTKMANEVPASLAPLAYVATMLSGYVVALLASGLASMGPSQLCAHYPARSLFQLCVAVGTLPHFVTVLLWFIMTKSRRVLLGGLAKFVVVTASYYITLEDSSSHGTWALSSSVLSIIWMFFIYKRAGHSRHRATRLKVLVGSLVNLALSVQFLAHYVGSGDGYWRYSLARATSFLLEIYFESLAAHDFKGIWLSIDYASIYDA